MDINDVWKSQWFKILLITLGIIMVICAIYSLVTSSSWGSICLIVMGLIIGIFGILLYLWHHNEKFKNKAIDYFTTTSSENKGGYYDL